MPRHKLKQAVKEGIKIGYQPRPWQDKLQRVVHHTPFCVIFEAALRATKIFRIKKRTVAKR